MLVITFARKERLPTDAQLWLHLTVMAVMTNIAPYLLFAWAEVRVSSGLAGVLNATTPLFTVLIALATRTERPLPSTLLGLAIGMGGVVIIAAPWSQNVHGPFGAIAAVLIASAAYAAAYVYARRFLTPRSLPALVLSTGQMVAGTVVAALLAPLLATQTMHLTAAVFGAVVTLGVAGTGVAYVLNYQLIDHEGPTAASTVAYLIPVVAVALGAIVLGEPITWTLVIGGGTILVGVALTERRFGHRVRSRAGEPMLRRLT